MTRAADPWIELHVGFPENRKLRRLARRLGISKPTAAGHLIFLWTWAMRQQPDGVLRGYDSDELAEAAGFDGDSTAFVEALISEDWIDRRTSKLHDWDLYAGKLLERRAANRARMQRARAQHGDAHVRRYQTVEDRTEPNQTEPNQDQEQDPFDDETSYVAAKYLGKLAANSPQVFGSFTSDAAFEIAGEYDITAAAAARMLGDVWEWWRAAPASRRWKSSAAKGWRTWCRREAERAAERAAANGKGQKPAAEPSCPSCGMPRSVGHAEDCPTLAKAAL